MAVWLVFGVALASLCAGLVAVVCLLWTNRVQTTVPGPPTVPLLGNGLHFYRQPVLLDRFTELHRKYGDVFRFSKEKKMGWDLIGSVWRMIADSDISDLITADVAAFLHGLNSCQNFCGFLIHRFYIGPKLVIVVTQPEDIKRVLLSSKPQTRDPFFTYVLRKIIVNGLLTNDGEMWESHRKLLEPAFHFSELERYLDIFNKEGRLLTEKLAATGGAEVDVYSCICLCTLRSVAFALTGLEFNRFEPDPYKQAEVANEIYGYLKTLSAIMFRPWKAVQGLMWMSAEGRELKRRMKICEDLFGRFVVLLKEEFYNYKNPQREFLASFLSEENTHEPLTDDEILDEVKTIGLTASETTAGSMAYTLTLLGLHPEWQEKAWRELDQVFGGGDDFLRPVTKEDVSQLTVIDAIIKESLRLFPTVPIVPRLMAEDLPLAGGRYVAPQGCSVILPFCLMHRHPALFPDPEKFDPGRFLPGGSATSRRSFSYLPFSAGPRRCLGGHFATLEMKILLAVILRRFRIIPGSSRDELEEALFCITSHPLTGFRVSCVPREETTCK